MDLGPRGPAASLALALAALAMPAQAADRYQFDALGFSEDGHYFAFEQFVIQDGSGFPVSEIFIIDLDTDSFAAGSPFEVRIESDGASLSEARGQAGSAAAEAATELGIFHPAVPVALSGDGELGDDRLSMSFGIPKWGLAETEGEYQLGLDIFKAPSGEDCVEWFGEEPMGYALTLATKTEAREIHRDTRVPASRGCVITYKLYGVFMPFEAYDLDSAIAVLSVWSHGFEGPDRKFIALPIGDRE
ncbi:DUF2259 domain-containing protein [Pelagibacterium halotolerans]|uniref:DUF2259 domain-containing protein n=1 Tax=Pelagibacterium halotolerans TaxID=531813 RepID=UPI003850C843